GQARRLTQGRERAVGAADIPREWISPEELNALIDENDDRRPEGTREDGNGVPARPDQQNDRRVKEDTIRDRSQADHPTASTVQSQHRIRREYRRQEIGGEE